MTLIIKEGDTVILDVNGERKSFAKLKGITEVKVGKHFVPIAPLLGAPYGAVFEVTADGKSLQRVLQPPPDEITRITDTEKDNSNLFDRNYENQKLSHEEIESLKKSGKAGAEIIDALCSNSATFQTKTEFAQDKYKRRKAKKYITYVTVRRPTALCICDSYFEKGPERIWNLRSDSLAIVMSLANISAGAKVLVLENCQGLVTAAVAERLGGYGHVCAAHTGGYAPLDAVKSMNLTHNQLTTVCVSSLFHLHKAQAAITAGASTSADAQPAAAAAGSEAAAAGTSAPADADAAAMDVDNAAAARDASTSAPEQQEAAAEAEGKDAAAASGSVKAIGDSAKHHFTATDGLLTKLLADGFTSCIVADPRVHPSAALDKLWPLLAPSATFVVYSPWVQPLAETFNHLQTAKCSVLLQLQESWLRPYQVLPARTHPEMTCTGTGGFILSGIKVESEPGAPSLGEVLSRSLAPTPAPMHVTGHAGKDARQQAGGKRQGGPAYNGRPQKQGRR